MKSKLLLLFLVLATIGAAQQADSLRKLLPLARTDTARISIYIAMAATAEDSSLAACTDTALFLINQLEPGADKKMATALAVYRSEAFYQKANFFSGAEMYDSAIHYLNKALVPARAANNKKQEALILNDLGVCSWFRNDVISTISYMKSSLAIREELGDEADLRNAYNNMAFIYKETGLLEQSLELNFKSLALAEKTKNQGDISTSLNNIGQVYHKYLLDYPKALEYYNKSLALRLQSGNKKDIGLIKNNIASLYADMGRYNDAILYYTESLSLRREAGHKYGIVQTLSNLAYNYFKLGEYDKALAFLNESAQANTTLNDQYLQEGIYYNYAEVYHALHQTDSAIYHALMAHDINVQLGNPLDISKSAELLSRLYENTGEPAKALHYYKVYTSMQDSVVNDKLQKDGVKKELEYEYLKKQNETEQLHARQLAKKNLFTGILTVLLITGVVLGIVLRNRYQLKQRLKEVELRNRIAADLHDDVGATLSSISMYSSIVGTQVKSSNPESAALLDKIISNSKEMIGNMSDIVWMIKPGNDSFVNIENRMQYYASEVCGTAGINFELTSQQHVAQLKLPMELRRDLYLIFKEAVNNAVKYAGCKAITASISLQHNTLQLFISDDGNGFDVSSIKQGNGLDNMKKRAESHGGNFSISSSAGKGTEIIVAFPV